MSVPPGPVRVEPPAGQPPALPPSLLSSAPPPAPIAEPTRLVIRLPNPVGDAVMATPALRALRRALPRTQIVWAGTPSVLAVLDGLKDRAETFEISGDFAHGVLAPMRVGRAWRKDRADAVLVLPNSRSALAAARWSRAAVRVGTRLRGGGRGLTHVVEVPMADGGLAPQPMTEHYLRLAAPFGGPHGLSDDGLGVRLEVTRDGEAAAEARLRSAGLLGPFVAVSPGAGFGPSKVYPPRLLAEVITQVRAATGIPALILCGPGEEDLARETAERAGPQAVSTDRSIARWPETKSLLKRAALLMCTDAGPRHVAAAFSTPCVVWMGPTDPRWSGGAGRAEAVVRREDLSCLACHLRTCPIGHPCMEGLPPTAVAAACVNLVSRSRERAVSGGGGTG